MNEAILIKSAAGNKEIQLKSLLGEDGYIVLDEGITSATATQFIMLMKHMADERRDVKLLINSPGGEVNAGLVMYDVIQSYPYELDICCIQLAASMASLLLASGKKGHRFILPHAKVLIHEPLIGKGFGGSATSIERTAHDILDVKAHMSELYSKHTGKTVEEINEATAFDNLMTAEEAIKFGLCDTITPWII